MASSTSILQYHGQSDAKLSVVHQYLELNAGECCFAMLCHICNDLSTDNILPLKPSTWRGTGSPHLWGSPTYLILSEAQNDKKSRKIETSTSLEKKVIFIYLFILPYKTFGETGMFFCFGCYIYLLVFDNGDMGMHPWLKEAHPSSRWISIFHICSLNSMVFTTMLVSMQIWSIFFFLIWVNSRKTTVLLAIVPNL